MDVVVSTKFGIVFLTMMYGGFYFILKLCGSKIVPNEYFYFALDSFKKTVILSVILTFLVFVYFYGFLGHLCLIAGVGLAYYTYKMIKVI